jgi:hypothetical protein
MLHVFERPHRRRWLQLGGLGLLGVSVYCLYAEGVGYPSPGSAQRHPGHPERP